MTVPTHKTTPTSAEYDGALARLRQVREDASAGVKAAQERGDIGAGSEWVSKLQKEFDEFRAFREGIPREVLLSINGDRILKSFSIDKDNFVNLVIPADISDEDAMHALNVRFRQAFPREGRDGIDIHNISKFIESGNGSDRRYHGPRNIKLIGVVPGTEGRSRDKQEEVLKEKGLTFAHPIEQALAAAAYSILHAKNLFELHLSGGEVPQSGSVRGSVPGKAIKTNPFSGVGTWHYADGGGGAVAASGIPFRVN